MKKIIDFLMDIIFPIIVVLLTIALLFFIGMIIFVASDESKMRECAESIFYFDKNTYYIDSYEYSGDQIIARDVNGKEIIFPKGCTVIEDK
jgi:hypothetical protein